MKIGGVYSFNKGEDYIDKHFPDLLKEVKDCIASIDKTFLKTKVSQEKTMKGKKLYSPDKLNKKFKEVLAPLGWEHCKVECEYSTNYYTNKIIFFF